MLFRFGTTAKVPTLWLYSENDQFWGKKLPLEWLAAYAGAGGKGEFVQLPPYKEDGHASFVGNRAAWQPAFEQFLRKLDFLPASPRISDTSRKTEGTDGMTSPEPEQKSCTSDAAEIVIGQ